MKKVLAIVLAVIIMMLCCGCNMGMGFGNFTFEKVHICDFSGHYMDATIEKWYDSESGIEVQTKEYGSMFLSEGTYVLYSDKCPLCNAR